jgi:lipoprotein-anchoring transpeptidase ErfK/SrfK
VKWELELLTYISPWTDLIKWWMKTLTWKFKTTFSDKYHISWAIDSIKETNKGLIWAVMPYALHITWWIYAHAWYVNGQRKSHWCIRLPIYYAKWLYDIFEKKWNIDWFIYDN